jgi:hypothetical protein
MEAQEAPYASNGTALSVQEWTEVAENSAEMQENLSEFHLGLLGRLSSVEDSQRRIQDFLTDAREQMRGIVSRHENLLVGTLEKPGLIVRLDRLEVAQGKRDKMLMWAATTLFAAMVTLAVKVFQ